MKNKKIHVFKLPWSQEPFTPEEEASIDHDSKIHMEPSDEEIEEYNRLRLKELQDPDNEIIVHDFTNK